MCRFDKKLYRRFFCIVWPRNNIKLTFILLAKSPFVIRSPFIWSLGGGGGGGGGAGGGTPPPLGNEVIGAGGGGGEGAKCSTGTLADNMLDCGLGGGGGNISSVVARGAWPKPKK